MVQKAVYGVRVEISGQISALHIDAQTIERLAISSVEQSQGRKTLENSHQFVCCMIPIFVKYSINPR